MLANIIYNYSHIEVTLNRCNEENKSGDTKLLTADQISESIKEREEEKSANIFEVRFKLDLKSYLMLLPSRS